MDCAAVEVGSAATDANRDTRRRRGWAGWLELMREVIDYILTFPFYFGELQAGSDLMRKLPNVRQKTPM